MTRDLLSAEDLARIDAAAAAAPPLTAAQRNRLRPLLEGTYPAPPAAQAA